MVRARMMTLLMALTGCGASSGSDTRTSTATPTQVSLPEGRGYQLELTRAENVVRAVVPAEPGAAWSALPRVYREIGLSPEEWTVHDPTGRRVAVADLRVGRIAGERLEVVTRFHGQQGQRGPLCASRGRIEREDPAAAARATG